MNIEELSDFAGKSVVEIRTPSGGGSGWIYKVDEIGRAWILTNEHVVSNNPSVDVFIDGKPQKLSGTVVGVDDVHDLAVLTVCCESKWQALEFASGAELSAGTEVIAFGFPYRAGVVTAMSVTAGIVSSFGYDPGRKSWIVQTDAALNPGNSGGPIVNRDGEVVGVVSFKIESTPDERPVDNIGFAIAAKTVLAELPQLEAGRSTLANPSPTPEPEYKAFFLEEGQLNFDDDRNIEEMVLIDDIRNFHLSSTFEVPYSVDAGAWDYGILFRYTETGEFSSLRVQSDGRFVHSTFRNGEWKNVKHGTAYELKTYAGAKNHISFFVIDNRAWLGINGALITDFDVSDSHESGSLKLATQLTRNSIPGETISFENLIVLQLLQIHGPTTGELTKSSSYIATTNAGVRIFYGYAIAEFLVPRGITNWSVGIGFRRGRDGDWESDYLVFSANHQSGWVVSRATTSGDGWKTLNNGRSSSIDTRHPTSNRLEVFFVGNVAYGYVNGELLGKTDIEPVHGRGDVAAMFGIIRDHDNGSTRFSDFSVWGLPDFGIPAD